MKKGTVVGSAVIGGSVIFCIIEWLKAVRMYKRMDGLYKEKNGQLSFIPVEESKFKDTYSYNGPVFLFDVYIGRTELKTQAVSLAKAYANMIFQVKNQLGYKPNTKITISKNLIKKEELKYGKTY